METTNKELSNIGYRIDLIIKSLELTKTSFAKKLKISQPYVSQLISCDRIPSERLLDDISEKFNINRDWLTTGKGGTDNMFIQTDAITKAYNHFGYIMEHSSPYKKATLTAMIEMIDCVPDDKWGYIVDTFQNAYTQALKEKEES